MVEATRTTDDVAAKVLQSTNGNVDEAVCVLTDKGAAKRAMQEWGTVNGRGQVRG